MRGCHMAPSHWSLMATAVVTLLALFLAGGAAIALINWYDRD